MKGMALHDRLKEKDAWDIYFTATNYPGGIDVLAKEIRLHLAHGLVQEGLQKIARSSHRWSISDPSLSPTSKTSKVPTIVQYESGTPTSVSTIY
jgi:hypothetical protein